MARLEAVILLMALCGMVGGVRFFDAQSLSQVGAVKDQSLAHCESLTDGFSNNDPQMVLDALGNLSNLAMDIGPRSISLFKLVPSARGYGLEVRSILTGDPNLRFVAGVRSSLDRRQLFVGGSKIMGPIVVSGLAFEDVPFYGEMRRSEKPIAGFLFPVKFYHRLLPFSRLANANACTLVTRLLSEISRQEASLSEDEILILPPLLSCWQEGKGTYPVAQVRRSTVEQVVVYYPELVVRPNGWVRPSTTLKWALSIQTRQTLGRAVFSLKFGDEMVPVEPQGLGISDLIGAEPLRVEDF